MKLTGGEWSKGDLFAGLGLIVAVAACIAAILAIPGMPKVFHWDSETHAQTLSSEPKSSPASITEIPNPVPQGKRPNSPVKRHQPKSQPNVSSAPPSQSPLSANPSSPQPGIQNCVGSNCIIGPNYGNPTVNNYDKPIPPKRFIGNDAATNAAMILRSAPAGTEVHVSTVGGSEEVVNFSGAIRSLFRVGLWTVSTSSTQFLNYSYGFASGRIITIHGEGVTCTSFSKRDSSATAAIDALRTAGFPCKEIYDPQQDSGPPKTGPVLQIIVGTRIIPPSED